MSKVPGAASRVFTANLGSPALGTDAAVLADTAMANGATTDVTVFAAQPDVPRNVTVKGNAASVAGNVVVTGKNAAGQTITETIALNGTNLVAGNKAFASISNINLPAYASVNTERVRVGTGAKLGLPTAISRNSVIAAFLAGVRETTAPTVAFSASALESNTATLNSALNGSAVIVDYYETN